jgi:hypothetical protein
MIVENTSQDIEFHFWYEDREKCLYNDKYRREQNSELTIKNAPLEQPDIKMLQEVAGPDRVITLNNHFVEYKSNYQMFKDKMGISGEYVYSGITWSLGGCGKSGDGDTWAISAEPQPQSFTEFIDLLERIDPNVTFLQFLKLQNNCVYTEDFDDSDYYAETRSGRFVLDVEKFYNTLLEMDIDIKL